MTTFPEVLKDLCGLPTPIIDKGMTLISDLLGGPFRETGDLISEQIYAWRWANRLRIAKKAAERLAELGVSRKVLPPGFLIPLLESCGNADDESLQDMWASLLAEGVCSKKTRQATYRVTLESLSPEDAKWLVELRRLELSDPGQVIMTQVLPRRGSADGTRGGSDGTNGRLLALGLLTAIISRELQTVREQPDYQGTGLALYSYELSDYARQFLAVVGNGKFPWPSRSTVADADKA